MSLVFTESQYSVDFSLIIKVFITTYQKREVLCKLHHSCFSISRNFKTFHLEVNNLKTILRNNNYSSNFINLCIKSFLNNLYTPKVIAHNVTKRDVFVKLPFLGSSWFQIWKEFQKWFTAKLMSCNLKVLFTTFVINKSFFPFMDKLSKMLLSGLVC